MNGTMHSNSNGHSVVHVSRQNTLHDYLAMFYRGRWLIVLTFLITMVIVTGITFTMNPVYEASTTIMIAEKQGMGESLFDVTGFTQRRTQINNQVEILKSRALAGMVVENLLEMPGHESLQLLTSEDGATKDKSEITTDLRLSIFVSPVRETDLIRVHVKAPSPYEAALLANSIVKAFQDLDRDLSRGEISQVVEFLSDQLNRKEVELKNSEGSLRNFLQEAKIASLSDEASQVVEEGAKFESMYKGAIIELEGTQKRLDYLKNQLGISTANLESEISRVSSPLVLQLRKEMADIERNIAIYLSQGVFEDDPQVRFERNKLKAIKERLTEEIRKLVVQGLPPDDPLTQAQGLVLKILEGDIEMASLRARAAALEKVVEEYRAKLESLPEKNVQLARLERNRKVDENLYMMMREKFEESRITQAGQIGKVRIIDTATPPIAPISPKKRLNLLFGIIIGVGLGVGLTYLREYLDRSVRGVEELESMGLTVFGAIPEIAGASKKNLMANRNGENGNGEAGRLVTHYKPKSPISEAYRTVRTNLQFADPDKTVHSFLVTSTGPGEGKSTTAANLAIALSQQGSRTVLIDTDLRRPMIHKIFNLDKHRGLTNLLVGKSKLEEVIQPSGIAHFDVITAGILPPNPAELLGSQRMKDLTVALKARYDVCIYDTPPLIAVTDAAIVSKELDGVLLVVKAAQTHKDALLRALDLLENVRARILGVVLNGVSKDNSYGSHYYYNDYYSYYGDNGEKKHKKVRSKKSVA
jgi:tyrosine-protein kinase Etk/Wzc